MFSVELPYKPGFSAAGIFLIKAIYIYIFFLLCKSAGTDFWQFDKMQDVVFENVPAVSLAHISNLRCIGLL